MNSRQAITKAIKILGGQAQASRAVDVSRQVIWSWINVLKHCPGPYAIPLEKATNGQITRHQLRPDIFGVKP